MSAIKAVCGKDENDGHSSSQVKVAISSLADKVHGESFVTFSCHTLN